MTNESLETTCCVVGGGPAGMMLGYLLARSGIAVTVLEKHTDFFRDFRGDTVHPSTMDVLYELDLLDDFLRLPHQRVFAAGVLIGDFASDMADFRHVPAHCQFIALLPQWDFLRFLSDRAKAFPTFNLRMGYEAVDLVQESGRVTGVVVSGPQGEKSQIRAHLVAACDGRHSTMRNAAGLELREFGVPIDVLWFRISRKPGDPAQVLGNVNYGKALILINRSDYFQAGLIIPKGSYDEIRQRGLEAFRESIRQIAPYLGDRVEELRDWDQVKVLTVQINRLRRWYRDGLLCIGDAAHAMSPAGGVGINLAIQDAVAAANLLTGPLQERRVGEAELDVVQRRREFPARITQAVQVRAHQGFAQVFRQPGPLDAPWQFRLAVQAPGVRRLLGYAVGIGARPEHVAGARRAGKPAARRACAFVVGFAAGVIAGMAVWWVRESVTARDYSG